MPKKAATARNGAQRNKAKTQKRFEIVRQDVDEQELIEDEQVEIAPVSTPALALEVAETTSRPIRSARRAAARASVATQEIETAKEVDVEATEVETAKEDVTVPSASATKGSASARLAARRGQKTQQRSNATLITAEHYTYVTRDLKIIAVLASVMFVAIIVLYFTIGR